LLSLGTRARIYAARIMTTTLTTKRAHIGAKYTLWRIDYRTELLGLDNGGHDSVELENRQRLKSLVGSNPTPSATES
jgi:hypothetical protein